MNTFFQKIVHIFNHKLFLSLVIIACVYTQATQSDRYFGWSNPKNTLSEHDLVINSDGSGYYVYLPQWFIYSESPNFSFLLNVCKSHHTNKFIAGIGRNNDTGNSTSKYSIGTAVCISPFFLLNHGVQKMVYGKGDGYSKSYQFSIALAALFYSLLGLIGLVYLLKRFSLTNFSISLLICFVALGTSENFYASHNPAFSHVYSFCVITWLLYFTKLFGDTRKTILLIWISFLLGIVFLLRPTNVLILLFLPFMFPSVKSFIKEVKLLFSQSKLVVILSVLTLFTIVFSQLYSNYLQFGKWSLNTYSTEHFDFLFHPKWFEVLFGYEKGYFMYSPLLFLLFPAYFIAFKKNHYLFLGWLLVFLIFLYLTSSWWCWWYGGGLGMRPFVDITSFIILPIALFYHQISNWLKLSSVAFAFCGIYMYQIYQIQFKKNILHYDLMTKEKYWSIFMKTDDRYAWMSHFDEQVIDEKLIKSKKTISFSPIFSVLTYENQSPRITYITDSLWGTSKVGIRFKGEMLLTDQQSNPSFYLEFFDEGKSIKTVDQYIGNRIDELKVYYPFSKDYIGDFKYNEFDSVRVTLTKGIPITKIKQIQCTFYSLID